MNTAVNTLRLEYALAYSENLSSGEGNKLRPGESAQDYAKRWHQEYGQHMTRKIIPVVQTALQGLANGRSFTEVQYDVHRAIFWDAGMEVARVLIGRIPQLKYALLTEKDSASFRERLELIVEAFGTPNA